MNIHISLGLLINNETFGDFPGGPVVKALLPLQGARV